MAIPLRGNMALQPHVSAMKLSKQNSKSGFTLFETVIALLMIGLLFGMVFATSRAALDLGNNIVKTQDEEMLHQAFFDLLEKRFTTIPGNTRLDLKVTDTASHYLSDLTLENVPLSFTWGNQERTAKAVQLSTVMRRSGFLDIVMRYYENPILDATSSEGTGSSFKSSSTEETPFAEITLLTDVRYFEWRVLNPALMEYQYDWEESSKLPIQLELTCAFGADGEPMRHIFWIPPKQNPEVFMKQLKLQGGNADNPQNGIEIGVPSVPVNPSIPVIPPQVNE
jgi:type II secretory pathway pseudopilin PulG